MIAIVDYGVGNLLSVQKALEFIGADAAVTTDPIRVGEADAVVLPGVGAFSDAMKNLSSSRMDLAVKDCIRSGRPFLGICLGMQLLFDYSEEGGERTAGLGIFRGAVRHLDIDPSLKIPHMGWNRLEYKKDNALFRGLPDEAYVYFVHSYHLVAEEKSLVIATAAYGVDIEAAVNRDNVYATQFHPEKSGDVGLKMLKNFAALTRRAL